MAGGRINPETIKSFKIYNKGERSAAQLKTPAEFAQDSTIAYVAILNDRKVYVYNGKSWVLFSKMNDYRWRWMRALLYCDKDMVYRSANYTEKAHSILLESALSKLIKFLSGQEDEHKTFQLAAPSSAAIATSSSLSSPLPSFTPHRLQTTQPQSAKEKQDPYRLKEIKEFKVVIEPATIELAGGDSPQFPQAFFYLEKADTKYGHVIIYNRRETDAKDNQPIPSVVYGVPREVMTGSNVQVQKARLEVFLKHHFIEATIGAIITAAVLESIPQSNFITSGLAAYVYPHPHCKDYAAVRVYANSQPIEIAMPHSSLSWLYKNASKDTNPFTNQKDLIRFRFQVIWQLIAHPFTSCSRIEEKQPTDELVVGSAYQHSLPGFNSSAMIVRCADLLSAEEFSYRLSHFKKDGDVNLAFLWSYARVESVFGCDSGRKISNTLDELFNALLENPSECSDEETRLKHALLNQLEQFAFAVLEAVKGKTADPKNLISLNSEKWKQILAPIHEIEKLAKQSGKKYRDKRWYLVLKAFTGAVITHYATAVVLLSLVKLGLAAAVPASAIAGGVPLAVVALIIAVHHYCNAPSKANRDRFTLFSQKPMALVNAVDSTEIKEAKEALRGLRASGKV